MKSAHEKATEFALDYADKTSGEYKFEYPELWEIAKVKTLNELIKGAGEDAFPKREGETFRAWRARISDALSKQIEEPGACEILIASNVVKALKFMVEA